MKTAPKTSGQSEPSPPTTTPTTTIGIGYRSGINQDINGALTVMFSDIEGSTRLNEELGDQAFVRLLAEHDRVVRHQVVNDLPLGRSVDRRPSCSATVAVHASFP